MGESRRTVIVHAFDDDEEDDGIGFSMSGFGVRNGEIRCSKSNARHGMRANDKHEIVFELANRSRVDLRFPANPRDAMWVSGNDTECPKSAMHQDEVVKAVSVSDDGERLTVENANEDRKRYKFALNFVGERGGQRKTFSYDPIWDNRNGNA